MKYVLKRDDRKVPFDQKRIEKAIIKAIEATRSNIVYSDIIKIKENVLKKINELGEVVSVEEIQDLVVSAIRECGYKDLANAYNSYRYERTKQRQLKLDIINTIRKIAVETDRDNANVGNNFSAKLLRIASEANK